MSRFVESLLRASTPVIMEIKRQDGDGVDLLRGRSTREIVDQYRRLGAPCISVVTGSWFGGTDELLREVAAVTSRPLLKKDFVTRGSQLAEARAMGAGAALLTAELLPARALGRLIEASLRCGITPFVEVAEDRQLERVVHARECVIAVNNRDIRERERGPGAIERSLSLLPALRRTGARCLVSSSGIRDPEDGARLLTAGFDGLLVGTGLLLADDPRAWIEQLRAWTRNKGAR
jgi:indole-3-glycerol phosphate synthase